ILLQQIDGDSERTTSFIRKGTLPVIAGNPPADAARPSGIKGMIVTVVMKVATEPMAPRTPAFLFQNPKNKSAPNNHSETPKNQLGTRMPTSWYAHEASVPLLISGIKHCSS